MTRIAMFVEPTKGSSNLTFISGKLHVVLSLDKSLPISEDYSFSFHTDTLHTLCYIANNKQVEDSSRTFKVDFCESQIWLPGDYFLLFRSGDTILRFDFQYDNQGAFTETGFRQCSKLSDEDILSGTLVPRRHWRVWFSSTPGGIQLKRWVIGRLQERAFNAIRSEYHYLSLDYCNNLLLASATTDYPERNLLLMRHLTELQLPTTSVDCKSLFDSDVCDPGYKVDDIFSEEEREILPDVTLPSLKEHVYSFTNIGALLEPGREAVLDRILAHCPSYYHSAIFCGTQQETDRLLELAPSLQGLFPQCNRLAMEPFTANEVIRLFFHELDLVKLTLTPEAADAACRFFYEHHQQDAGGYGSLKEIRQYIRCQVLPAYRRRAISAIQQGISPSEVLDLHPEDIC